MCGICGIVAKGKLQPYQVGGGIDSMTDALFHRGPDDRGVFSDEKTALGIRRLSIIDPAGGHQPIHNENKRIWIVFNGMVYNFADLRLQLEEKGHIFYTRTDTEAVVHLYEEYGPDCVLRLNGIFAFAIWEPEKERLFLARDRLGVKPLYYTAVGGSFLFASEMKALFRYPGVSGEIDPLALSQYLTFEYIPAPYSVFKGISKLPPAHTLLYKDGDLRIQKYWDPAVGRRARKRMNDGDALEILSGLFEDAVKIRLTSDVPKGLFLSGGLDSSLVAAVASNLSGGGLKTFSIGFAEPSFDESGFYREVAEFFHSEHRERIFGHRELLAALPAITGILDEPFAEPSILPTYLLSRFAKEDITVALSGDGGDEVFAGYPTYIAHKFASYADWLPIGINRMIVSAARRVLPVSTRYMSFDFRFKKFFSGLGNPVEIRHHLWLGAFSPSEKERLLSRAVFEALRDDDIFQGSRSHFERNKDAGLLERIQYLDLKTYLPEVGLARVDAASMANGLEVRSPFLDYRLVEFALSLPSDLRLRRLTTKYILKKYAKGLLPKKIVNRRKKGFGIPLSSWISGELKGVMLDVLSEKKIQKEGFFRYDYIQKILQEHFAGRVDNRKQIWTLLMFELWLDKIRSG